MQKGHFFLMTLDLHDKIEEENFDKKKTMKI